LEDKSMSLAELLPAVMALSRDEQVELVQFVQGELARAGPATLFDLSVEYSGGHGLFDEASCAAAEMIRKAVEEHKRKKKG
jgi:hypothetical protein